MQNQFSMLVIKYKGPENLWSDVWIKNHIYFPKAISKKKIYQSLLGGRWYQRMENLSFTFAEETSSRR